MDNASCGATTCRTCLNHGRNFHSMLEYESVSNLQISDILMATVPQLHIQPGVDKLPVQICGECLNKLNIAYRYQQLCIQTDKRLKAMLVHDGGDADDEEHVDIPSKKEILEPEEFATDPSVHNGNALLPLDDSCIKVENEIECEEFLYSQQEGENGLFKAITNDKTTTASEEDAINEAEYTARDQNEIGVTEIKKPLASYRRKGRYPCLVCKKKFDNSFLLRRHSVVHSITRLHECDICKYRFTTENMMKSHKATHRIAANTAASPDGYKCPLCPRRFAKNQLLSAHFRSHRRGKPHQIFQCEYCPKQFRKLSYLTQHRRIHPENHCLKCHLCERTFAINSHLKNHLKKHSGLKKYVCIHCDKAFFTNSNLKQHLTTHNSERSHICPQCGKAFKQRNSLYRHQQQLHSKRYHCLECSSKFFRQTDLSKHMSAHHTANTQPHICDICGSSFSRLCALTKHKQKMHSANLPYKCLECNKSFFYSGSMLRHMGNHTGEKSYQCKYCDHAYYESKDLTKHLRSHVGESTNMCDECPKAFKYKKKLQLHKMQHFKQKQLELETATAAVSSATETKESPTIAPTTIEVLLTTTEEGQTTASIGIVN